MSTSNLHFFVENQSTNARTNYTKNANTSLLSENQASGDDDDVDMDTFTEEILGEMKSKRERLFTNSTEERTDKDITIDQGREPTIKKKRPSVTKCIYM